MSGNYTCFLDDCEVNSKPNLDYQNVFLVGGWVCSKSVEQQVGKSINDILRPHLNGNIELPVKWNFKDLHRANSKIKCTSSVFQA